MSITRTKEGRLLAYMMGWKRGAAGSAFKDEEMRDLDFKRGWDHGREDSKKAYGWASKHYGAELNPLRTE